MATIISGLLPGELGQAFQQLVCAAGSDKSGGLGKKDTHTHTHITRIESSERENKGRLRVLSGSLIVKNRK